MDKPLLEVSGLNAGYGDFRVLFDIGLSLAAGQTLALIGANGAGKSTLLKAIVGLIPSQRGEVTFAGQRISGLPANRIARMGIGLVPEGRRLFPSLSVEENLLIGESGGRDRRWTLDSVYALFPVLKQKARMSPTLLSGGQQQMAAIGRTLMANPRLVLFDEISLGLAPVVINDVYAALPAILASGVSAIIVEQDITRALGVADTVVCLQKGEVALSGPPDAFTRDQIVTAYFGG